MSKVRSIQEMKQLAANAPFIKHSIHIEHSGTRIMQGFKHAVTFIGSEYADAISVNEWMERHYGEDVWVRAEEFLRRAQVARDEMSGDPRLTNIGIIKLVSMLNESKHTPFRYEMVGAVDDESVSIFSHKSLMSKIDHRGDVVDTKARLIKWVDEAHKDGFIEKLLTGRGGVSEWDILDAGLGAFRLHWLSGGTSVCAISQESDGTRCINIANWTWDGESASPHRIARAIHKIELIARD